MDDSQRMPFGGGHKVFENVHVDPIEGLDHASALGAEIREDSVNVLWRINGYCESGKVLVELIPMHWAVLEHRAGEEELWTDDVSGGDLRGHLAEHINGAANISHLGDPLGHEFREHLSYVVLVAFGGQEREMGVAVKEPGNRKPPGTIDLARRPSDLVDLSNGRDAIALNQNVLGSTHGSAGDVEYADASQQELLCPG